MLKETYVDKGFENRVLREIFRLRGKLQEAGENCLMTSFIIFIHH
jgi:hypothetical protein